MSTNEGEVGTEGVGDGDSSFKSAATSVLTFVGGKDENLDDRNSMFPDTSPFLEKTPADLPNDDTMFYGDGIAALPETLSEAVFADKNVDGLEGTYRKFRTKNTIDIGYDTTTNDTIKDGTIRVKVNSQKPNDTVTVTDTTSEPTGSFNASLKLFLPNSPELPSYTILADDWQQKSEKFEQFFSSQKKRAYTYPRHVTAEKGVYQTPDGRSIEGVRAATIWGVSNPYTRELLSLPQIFLDAWLPDNPIIYNWVELTLLADGTTYVRVPDASVFPRQVGYLRSPPANESTKRATSGLEYILDETANPADDRYAVAIRQDTNHVWDRFAQEFDQGIVVPYKSMNNLYHANYDKVDSPLYDHPVMAYGEAADGRELGQAEVLDTLSADPLFPMPDNDILSRIYP